MAITERSRHSLHQKLDSVLGPEEATTLMEHLPPVGWAEVATKTDVAHETVLLRTDLEHLGVMLRADMDRFGSELRGGMESLGTELRGEMERLGTELRGEMESLRTELRGGMEHLRTSLRAEILGETQGMFNRLLVQLLAAQLAFVTVVLLVERIG